jgi:predicted ATP-dependent endonuclease of OLD family
MKLVKAHTTNYRSILDSNPVDIGQTTCLVGKNEAGKTAFLRSLEGLRSTDPAFKVYGKTENYPRRYLAEYGSRHKTGEAPVILSEWRTDVGDIAAVEAALGSGPISCLLRHGGV